MPGLPQYQYLNICLFLDLCIVFGRSETQDRLGYLCFALCKYVHQADRILFAFAFAIQDLTSNVAYTYFHLIKMYFRLDNSTA